MYPQISTVTYYSPPHWLKKEKGGLGWGGVGWGGGGSNYTKKKKKLKKEENTLDLQLENILYQTTQELRKDPMLIRLQNLIWAYTCEDWLQTWSQPLS